MTVSVVRDATPGCGPSCGEWIAAQGKIVPETRAAFLKVLQSVGDRKLPVFIDSIGGSVPDAIAMGREIRARRLDVVVTRTGFEPCAGQGCPSSPATRSGRAHGIGSVCASACTLVLAAGTKREAAPWTLVGVHQIVVRQTMTRVERTFRVVSRMVDGAKVVTSRTLVGTRPLSSFSVTRKPSPRAYETVAAYLTDMGVGPDLLPLMRATPSTSIHWMTADEGRSTGLVTDRIDGEYVAAEAARTTDASHRGGLEAAAGSSIPEEALFIRAGAGADKVQTSIGRVTWALERPGSANPADVVLRADVEVPDTGVRLTLRMTRAPEATSVASAASVMNLTFATTPAGSVHTVDRVGIPQAGDIGQSPHVALDAIVQPQGTNAFQVRLAGDAGQLNGNEAVVEGQPWLGIPMAVDGGTSAILMMQHASSGNPLIAQAFRAWKTGSSQAFVPPAVAGAPRS